MSNHRETFKSKLSGAVNQESVQELIDNIEHAKERYFHDHVEIEINSHGGDGASLTYLLESLDRIRAEGVSIDTRGRGQVASAAAVLLALGDWRRADAGTEILLHHARVRSADVTATGSAELAQFLRRSDERIVRSLKSRMRPTYRPLPACEVAERLTDLDLETMRELLGNRKAVAREAVESLRLMDPQSILERLMALSRPISPYLTMELGLIDEVVDARPSRDRGGQPSGSGFRIPEWSPFFPGGEVDAKTLCRHVLILGGTGSGKTVSGILPATRALFDPRNAVGCALVFDPKGEILQGIGGMPGADLRVLDLGGSDGVAVNLMDGPGLDLAEPLARGEYMEAAHKILVRSLFLAPDSCARTLAGHASPSGERYWQVNGANLAKCILALTLSLLQDAADPGQQQRARDEPFPVDLSPGGLGATKDGRPRNVLALAAYVSRVAFGDDPVAKSCRAAADRSPDWKLKQEFQSWVNLKSAECGSSKVHFAALLFEAQSCFDPFDAGCLPTSVYFGCEKGLEELGAAHGVDFSRAVNGEEGRVVYVVRPAGQDADQAAKALKAVFFETVLNSAKRQRRGLEMPLVAYIADEAHRFATTGHPHGEDHFIDSCRSFGTFCVFATQGMSSLRGAIHDQPLEVLKTNTGTKLFFRTSEEESLRMIDQCSPAYGGPPLTRARPPAGLRPGECYASLASGGFVRRRIPLPRSRNKPSSSKCPATPVKAAAAGSGRRGAWTEDPAVQRGRQECDLQDDPYDLGPDPYQSYLINPEDEDF